jgi:transglutaminase-like putative cysteine protease
MHGWPGSRKPACRASVTLIIGMLALLTLCPGTHSSPDAATPEHLTNPKTYRVTYSFFFDIDSAVRSLQLWFPRLVEWESQRDVSIEEVSPEPTEEYVDPVHGHGVYYWELRNKRGRVTFKESYLVTAYDVVYEIDPDLVEEYDPSSELCVTYTADEPLIEADDGAIRETALEVVGDEMNPYFMACLIYDWVAEHMTYRSVDGLVGARFALANGYGECGDYAALFCALLRAVGVPARPVVGFWARSGQQTHRSDTLPYHVWAEFYLPGYGWVPADPERGDNSWSHDSDDYFACLDASDRLICTRSYNVQLPAGVVADIFQTYWFEMSGGSLRDWRVRLIVEELGTQD